MYTRIHIYTYAPSSRAPHVNPSLPVNGLVFRQAALRGRAREPPKGKLDLRPRALIPGGVPRARGASAADPRSFLKPPEQPPPPPAPSSLIWSPFPLFFPSVCFLLIRFLTHTSPAESRLCASFPPDAAAASARIRRQLWLWLMRHVTTLDKTVIVFCVCIRSPLIRFL